MATVSFTRPLKIVANGGPITSDVYKGDNSKTWKAGSLLKLSGGALTVCVDGSEGNVTLDTDATGASGARLFLALEDQLTAGTNYCSVQEIQSDTIIEADLCASSSGTPTAANVSLGASYALFQLDKGTLDAYGIVGVDVDNTTKPVANIVAKQTDYEWMDPTSDDNYGRVQFKILSAILA